jgi:hypothetical protein
VGISKEGTGGWQSIIITGFYQQVKIEGFHRSANAVDKRERSAIATAFDEDNMLIFTVF